MPNGVPYRLTAKEFCPGPLEVPLTLRESSAAASAACSASSEGDRLGRGETAARVHRGQPLIWRGRPRNEEPQGPRSDLRGRCAAREGPAGVQAGGKAPAGPRRAEPQSAAFERC